MGIALQVRAVRATSPIGFVAIGILFVCMATISGFAQASVEARTAAINRVLDDYRDDQKKYEPELLSLAGDKRYDDQLSDLSAYATNARLSREQTYIQRLSEIDTAGLPAKTRTAAEALLNTLIEDQEGDRAKMWKRPLDQFASLHANLLALAEKLSFDSVKDYDDYLSRLRKIPNAFSQIMTNLQLGAEAGRAPSPAGVDKTVSRQIQEVVAQTAEASPFAAPLKRFPASISANDRKRITGDMLDAISTDVIPSYQRLGRFIAAQSASTGTTAGNPAP